MDEAATPSALRSCFESIAHETLSALNDLTDVEVNSKIDLPEANTLFQLATHIVASTEYWVLQMVGGVDVHRDREAEFRAAGTLDELNERYRESFGRIGRLLDALPPAELARPIAIPEAYKRFASGESPADLTVAAALVGTVQHAALHEGHIQITKDLVIAKRPGSMSGAR